jgi:uncharacterized membrane protein
MTLRLELLHPVAVHFPVAFLTLGLAVAVAARFRGRPEWLPEAASRLLWLGTLAAWAALGLGLLAEEYVPHVPAAWKVLEEHETLAWWTAGLFTALSIWRWRGPRGWETAFLIAWAVAAGVLVSTAWHGGELVFAFGVGFKK